MSNIKKIAQNMSARRIWIDGHSYKINETNSDSHNLFGIRLNEAGKYISSFQIPWLYCQKLIYSPDKEIDSIERKTKTKFTVSKHKACNKTGHIHVEGNCINEVGAAREELHSAISSIRHRTRPMQFVAIPTLSNEVKNNFIEFKNKILEKEGITGMHESIFQQPEKLHMTIAVFTLLNEAEQTEAIKTLNLCKTDIIEPILKEHGPLTIRLKGIDCMGNQPTKSNVLFAKAQFETQKDELKLQNVANEIMNSFKDKGLSKENRDDVKIHVTLINTKYRQDPTIVTQKRKYPKRIGFNATEILKEYRDYDFGTVNFDSLHLSLISAVGEDGFYKPLSVIKLLD